MCRLQNYVTNYRTNKARQDFGFQKGLFERKKKEYEIAQENYAKFSDANKNIILQSYRAEQVRLENEMNLAYQVYTSVAQQLQIAEAKVQEITPVYTIVEPATIPVKASKPSKARKHPISRLDGRLISIYFCDKLKIPIYVTIQ